LVSSSASSLARGQSPSRRVLALRLGVTAEAEGTINRGPVHPERLGDFLDRHLRLRQHLARGADLFRCQFCRTSQPRWRSSSTKPSSAIIRRPSRSNRQMTRQSFSRRCDNASRRPGRSSRTPEVLSSKIRSQPALTGCGKSLPIGPGIGL